MTMIDAAKFIVAGKATFTISPSEAFKVWLQETHGVECLPHYTYKIARSKDQPGKEPVYFVSLLTGPDNWTNYTYMGLLNTDTLDVRLTGKSRYRETSAPYLVLKAVLQRLASDKPMPDGCFRHEGKCCRCGRKLTVPSSIDSGIGPECAGKL